MHSQGSGPSDFRITYGYDEKSDDEGEMYSSVHQRPRVSAPAHQRGVSDIPDTILDASDPRDSDEDSGLASMIQRVGGVRSQRRKTPSRIVAWGSGGIPNEVIPHARFFIQEKKSSVSIKFDPPV